MICETCNHESKEAEPHEAGQCKQRNCGQSEILYPNPLGVHFVIRTKPPCYSGGERVLPARQI